MTRDEYIYVGAELEVFKHARNWKRYWSSAIAPYLRGAVLEVGAGVGANSPYLLTPAVNRLVCLEPDAQLVDRVRTDLGKLTTDRRVNVDVREGVVQTLTSDERFDAIVYLDVLEHIERDREEVATAAAHLRPNGHLVVLAPAFQSLYSAFDRAIGHHRRYTASTLLALTPDGLALERAEYLDALGACLSAANRLLLRKSTPALRDIAFWDRYVIPVSRVVDRLLGRSVGRSVLCVWRNTR